MDDKLLKLADEYTKIYNVSIQSHKKYGICITSMYFKSSNVNREILYIDGDEISNILYRFNAKNAGLCMRFVTRNGNDSSLYSISDVNMTQIELSNEFRQFETLYYFGKSPCKDLVKKIYKLFSVVPRPARPINRLAFLDISVKTE